MKRIKEILDAQGYIWLQQARKIYQTDAGAREAVKWLVRNKYARLTRIHGYYEKV